MAARDREGFSFREGKTSNTMLFLRDHGSAPHGGRRVPGRMRQAGQTGQRLPDPAASAAPRRTAPSVTAITKFAEEPVNFAPDVKKAAPESGTLFTCDAKSSCCAVSKITALRTSAPLAARLPPASRFP
jgi:hypothetical protein